MLTCLHSKHGVFQAPSPGPLLLACREPNIRRRARRLYIREEDIVVDQLD